MKNRLYSFLHVQAKTPVGVAITVAVMALLIAGVYAFGIPNPNMILIAGLVVCSALFGYAGGVTAAVIMVVYTLFFFSAGNDFVTFTGQNRSKVLVALFGIIADMLFVCELKRVELNAFREIQRLTDELQQDNRMLKEFSLTDALTGLRNRYALRHDYPLYTGQDVHVALVDIDNFKSINDEYGHNQGDRMLSETGKLLQKVFGEERCYRYGGDEFLLIVPHGRDGEFEAMIQQTIDQRPGWEVDGRWISLEYSIGSVRGSIRHSDDLRILFSQADEKMYEAKRHQKHAAKA